MEPQALRNVATPIQTAPTAPAPVAAETPAVALQGDRFVSSRTKATDDFAQLSAGQKAWQALSLAGRRLPGTLWEMVRHPGQLLSGLAAPILHPVTSFKDATAAVREASKQGTVEAVLAGVKGYGGLLSAWGLPISIALAPFTGGASLVASAAMVAGTVGLAATGASLAKNTVDAARAGSQAELEAQAQEMVNDGVGLATAAATVGAAKLGQAAFGSMKVVPVPEETVVAPTVITDVPKAPPPAAKELRVAPKPQEPKHQVIKHQEPKQQERKAAPKAHSQGRVAEAAEPKPTIHDEPAAPAQPAPSAAIVRQALPEHPQAMEQAVTDKAAFYMPQKVNYMPGLLKEAGFDGLPTLAAEADLDAAVAKGATELYRGVSKAEYADQFRTGELYIGMKNANGSGTWVGAGAEARGIASKYASGNGAVIRMALKPEAKVVTFEEITKALKAEKAQAVVETNAARERLKAAVEAAASPEEAARIKKEGQSAIDAEIIRNGFRFEDVGRYGVLKGYDAIFSPSTNFMNVLNRTTLIVQDTNASRQF